MSTAASATTLSVIVTAPFSTNPIASRSSGACVGNPSSATSGITYVFRVAGKNSATGTVHLTAGRRPSNASPANARALPATTARTSDATNAFLEPTPGSAPISYSDSTGALRTTPGRTAWFSLTPTQTRRATLSITRPAFDPAIALFRIETGGSLTARAS